MVYCEHPTAQDHTAGHTKKGRIIWVCSWCGKRSTWREGWRYLGTIECKRCWRPIVERVQCAACAVNPRKRQAGAAIASLFGGGG